MTASTDEDAKFNRDVVKKRLEELKKQQQQKQKEGGDSKDNKDSKDQQDKPEKKDEAPRSLEGVIIAVSQVSTEAIEKTRCFPRLSE